MAASRTRKALYARRRQKRMRAVEHDLTHQQWLDLRHAWGGCAYCGVTDKLLQRDCVLALSRGGRYTLDNVVPACRSCNTSKCNDEVNGWLRRKKLDERAFLLRYAAIRAELRRMHDEVDQLVSLCGQPRSKMSRLCGGFAASRAWLAG